MIENDAVAHKTDASYGEKQAVVELDDGRIIDAAHHFLSADNSLLHVCIEERAGGIDVSIPLTNAHARAWARTEAGAEALGIDTEDAHNDAQDAHGNRADPGDRVQYRGEVWRVRWTASDELTIGSEDDMDQRTVQRSDVTLADDSHDDGDAQDELRGFKENARACGNDQIGAYGEPRTGTDSIEEGDCVVGVDGADWLGDDRWEVINQWDRFPSIIKIRSLETGEVPLADVNYVRPVTDDDRDDSIDRGDGLMTDGGWDRQQDVRDVTIDELQARAEEQPDPGECDECGDLTDPDRDVCRSCVRRSWRQCIVDGCDAEPGLDIRFCAEHLTVDRDGVDACPNPLCGEAMQPEKFTCSWRCSMVMSLARERLDGASWRQLKAGDDELRSDIERAAELIDDGDDGGEDPDDGEQRIMTDGGIETGNDGGEDGAPLVDVDPSDLSGVDIVGSIADDDANDAAAVDGDALADEEDLAEEVTNSDGVLVATSRGLDAMLDTEGRFACTVCGSRSESAHGAKVHFGSNHDADDVPENPYDTDDSIDRGDGVGAPRNTADMTPEEVRTFDADDDAENRDDDGDTGEAWDKVHEAYTDASVQSSPKTKKDARNRAVEQLEAKTRWMSIRERSETGSTYDLWRWHDEHGWMNDAVQHIGEVLTAELGAIATDTETMHIVSQVARRNPVDQDETNGKHLDRTLIPVKNGVIDVSNIEYDADSMTIDWESVELLDKDPEHRFLFQIETEWDTENADVAGLDEWLETITRTDEARRLIWEFAGHSLHARYPADGFLVELGPGGSGKSQVLEVVKSMLGGDNVSVQTLQKIQTGRFTGQTVVDKRANINTELDGKKVPSLRKLKVYAAGEEDMVEGKGTPFYKANNDATMMFASDDPPALPQDNRAVGRRLYPVEFPCTYTDNPDPGNPFELEKRPKPVVQEELQAEARLQAALMRAVEGLVRLLEEGDFTSEKSWRDRVEQYESFADPIRDGIRTCLRPADDGAIETGDLERTMNGFFAAKDHNGRKMQQITGVLEEMPEYPVTRSRTRSFADDQEKHTVWKGVEFTADAKEHWVPDSAYWSAYGGKPGDAGGDAEDRVAVASLDKTSGRIDGTIRVEVNSRADSTKYSWDDQGVLVDDTDDIQYKIESGGTLEEGATYDVSKFVVGSIETARVVHIVPGLTTFTMVDDGSCDGDQNSVANTDDSDGEELSENARAVLDVLERENGDIDKDVLEELAKHDAGIHTQFGEAFDELLQSGAVYESGNGRLKTTVKGGDE